MILDSGGHRSYEWLPQCDLPVGVVDTHQYNDCDRHRSRTLFVEPTVSFAVVEKAELAELVVDLVASASVSSSFHISSEL